MGLVEHRWVHERDLADHGCGALWVNVGPKKEQGAAKQGTRTGQSKRFEGFFERKNCGPAYQDVGKDEKEDRFRKAPREAPPGAGVPDPGGKRRAFRRRIDLQIGAGYLN